MKELSLHPLTKQQIEDLQRSPAQAVMLVGPAGSGKLSLAKSLAEKILELPPGGLASYPYSLQISVQTDKQQIAIEAIRELGQFLNLKVPLDTVYNRAAIIEGAHLLSLEAQNALLKTLEEPPTGTLLILTTDYEQALLPTVRSRTQVINVKRPPADNLTAYFTAQDLKEADIKRAYTISGGLPGLMQSLLSEADHPLLQATEQARQILSQTSYQRLLTVDSLSKQPELLKDTLFILQQMAHISLHSATGSAAHKWQRVLRASYQASEALNYNAQPRLALANLALSL